ncbi:hypothetical protein K4L44_01145 [Halosquirtibacter laminarini]|uniref:Uncharacterized protein n=1 Tax=Halosquirtibacter laminarini TaxID=3374600 RepID=A0AC61NL17_9BACT|nr:hypothetical protein K4L44_01145 [Prolixibacteraceae bacterium]
MKSKQILFILLFLQTIPLYIKAEDKNENYKYNIHVTPKNYLRNDTIISLYEVESIITLEKNVKVGKLHNQVLQSINELVRVKTQNKIDTCKTTKQFQSILNNATLQIDTLIAYNNTLNSTNKRYKYLNNISKEISKEKKGRDISFTKKRFGTSIYFGTKYEVYDKEISRLYHNCLSLEAGFGISYKEILGDIHLNYGELKNKIDLNKQNNNTDKLEFGSSISYPVLDRHKWRLSPIIRYDYAIVSDIFDDKYTNQLNGYNKYSIGFNVDYIISRRLNLLPCISVWGKEIQDICLRGFFQFSNLSLPGDINGNLFQCGVVFNMYGRGIK